MGVPLKHPYLYRSLHRRYISLLEFLSMSSHIFQVFSWFLWRWRVANSLVEESKASTTRVHYWRFLSQGRSFPSMAACTVLLRCGSMHPPQRLYLCPPGSWILLWRILSNPGGVPLPRLASIDILSSCTTFFLWATNPWTCKLVHASWFGPGRLAFVDLPVSH